MSSQPSLWPPPRPVRPILAAARRHYHRLPVPRRPALSDPTSYLGLFTRAQLVALACSGYWPLPAKALAWLAASPRTPARRRQRIARLVEAVAPVLLDRLTDPITDIALAVAQEVLRGQ
jgi:hypothetical protein